MVLQWQGVSRGVMLMMVLSITLLILIDIGVLWSPVKVAAEDCPDADKRFCRSSFCIGFSEDEVWRCRNANNAISGCCNKKSDSDWHREQYDKNAEAVQTSVTIVSIIVIVVAIVIGLSVCGVVGGILYYIFVVQRRRRVYTQPSDAPAPTAYPAYSQQH